MKTFLLSVPLLFACGGYQPDPQCPAFNASPVTGRLASLGYWTEDVKYDTVQLTNSVGAPTCTVDMTFNATKSDGTVFGCHGTFYLWGVSLPDWGHWEQPTWMGSCYQKPNTQDDAGGYLAWVMP